MPFSMGLQERLTILTSSNLSRAARLQNNCLQLAAATNSLWHMAALEGLPEWDSIQAAWHPAGGGRDAGRARARVDRHHPERGAIGDGRSTIYPRALGRDYVRLQVCAPPVVKRQWCGGSDCCLLGHENLL